MSSSSAFLGLGRTDDLSPPAPFKNVSISWASVSPIPESRWDFLLGRGETVLESLGEFSCNSVAELGGSEVEVFWVTREEAPVSPADNRGLEKFKSRGHFWPVRDGGVEDVSFCILTNLNSPVLCLGMGIGLDTGPLAGYINSYVVSLVFCFLMLTFS